MDLNPIAQFDFEPTNSSKGAPGEVKGPEGYCPSPFWECVIRLIVGRTCPDRFCHAMSTSGYIRL